MGWKPASLRPSMVALLLCTLCSDLQRTHPATLSKLTQPPSAASPHSKGGAGLHRPSFTHSHCLHSYGTFPDGDWGSLSWKRKAGTGESYPGAASLLRGDVHFCGCLLLPPSLYSSPLSPSPVDLIVLMVRSELGTRASCLLLIPFHISSVIGRNLTLDARQALLWARGSVWLLSFS